MSVDDPRDTIARALELRLRCGCGTCASIAAEAVIEALRAGGWQLLRLPEGESAPETHDGAFGPVNSCCGVTSAVGHDLHCPNRESDE